MARFSKEFKHQLYFKWKKKKSVPKYHISLFWRQDSNYCLQYFNIEYNNEMITQVQL